MKFKMRKPGKFTVIAVGAMLACGVGLSQLQPVHAVKAMRACLVDKDLQIALKNHFKKRFFNLIEATEAQQEQISSIVDKQFETAVAKRAKMKEQAMDIAGLVGDENATDDQIKAKVENIRAMRHELQDQRLETALSIRRLLTKEQKEIVAARFKGILTGNPRLGLMDR